MQLADVFPGPEDDLVSKTCEFSYSCKYTWSFENRVSKKNQLILLLGNLKHIFH